jgi:hypothetical protein
MWRICIGGWGNYSSLKIIHGEGDEDKDGE